MKHVLFLFLLCTCRFSAQDIRGAYIRTEWVPATSHIYEYKITVNLFTDATMNIPRPTIGVHFGVGGSDGIFPLIAITNQNGISIKTYSATHLFSGPSGQAAYQVSYRDTFRVAGIKNIPNSETQQIYVNTNIFANETSIANSAAQINNLPFGNLTVEGDNVIYNPMCADTDGDSLTYQLINCYVPQYHLPVGAAINYSTGVLSVPKDSIGLYAYSIQINEFDKGIDNLYQYAHTTWMDFTLDITPDVGVKENKAMERYWKIGPNPVVDRLSVTPLNDNITMTAFSIENVLGQTVFKQTNSSQQEQIDLGFLQPGIYYLDIQTPVGRYVRKIIKE